MTFVPTRRRVTFLVTAIAACAAAAAGGAIADMIGLRATRGGVAAAAAGVLRVRDALVGLEVLTFAVAAVAWLAWQHRAHRNLLALGDQPALSPRRAITAWFVPVLNLVHVPRALHELAVLSRRRTQRAEHPRGFTVRLRAWWWTFVVSAVALPVTAVLFTEPTLGSMRALMLTHLVSAVLRIAAAVLAIHIALDVASRQDRRHAMGRFRVVQAA